MNHDYSALGEYLDSLRNIQILDTEYLFIFSNHSEYPLIIVIMDSR